MNKLTKMIAKRYTENAIIDEQELPNIREVVKYVFLREALTRATNSSIGEGMLKRRPTEVGAKQWKAIQERSRVLKRNYFKNQFHTDIEGITGHLDSGLSLKTFFRRNPVQKIICGTRTIEINEELLDKIRTVLREQF